MRGIHHPEPIKIGKVANGWCLELPSAPISNNPFSDPETIQGFTKLAKGIHGDPILNKVEQDKEEEEQAESLPWHIEAEHTVFFFSTFKEVINFLQQIIDE